MTIDYHLTLIHIISLANNPITCHIVTHTNCKYLTVHTFWSPSCLLSPIDNTVVENNRLYKFRTIACSNQDIGSQMDNIRTLCIRYSTIEIKDRPVFDITGFFFHMITRMMAEVCSTTAFT